MRQSYKCDDCSKTFNSRTHYYVHLKKKTCTPDAKIFKCRTCNAEFRNRKFLWRHKQNKHKTHLSLQETPWANGVKACPWTDEKNNIIDKNLKRIYETHKAIILRNHEKQLGNSGNKIKTFYNFATAGIDDVNFSEHLNTIFSDQKKSFKVNLSLGVILQHVESGEYRYFVPYSNSEVFERPQIVSNSSNISKMTKVLEKFNLEDQVLLQRPNTKWRPVLLTNITYSVYSTPFPLGSDKKLSPEWLRKKTCVITLDHGEGNLCAFRCLAYHFSKKERWIEKQTKQLFKKWCENRNVTKISNFKGLLLPDDIPQFETIFQVNVNIFYFDAIRKSASPLYLSKANSKTYKKHDSTMNLNCYQNHLTYIKNLSTYARKFKCRHCDRLFPRLQKLKQHENKPCWKKTIFNYPGGYYSSPKTLFDRLKDIADIDVSAENRCYEWFVMFDFEASLLEVLEKTGTDTLWTSKHHPMSVSICSNVPGYSVPRCFVNNDTKKLLTDMIEYLAEISELAKQLTEKKLNKVFSRLEEVIKIWGFLSEKEEYDEETSDVMKQRLSKPNVFKRMLQNLQSFNRKGDSKLDQAIQFNEWEEIEEEDVEVESEIDIKNCAIKMHNALFKLRTDLCSYCSQIPVLGFNSSRYDLNLIKAYIVHALELANQPSSFTVKKNNQYLCIATQKFRFLDVSQYLPPGTSYNQFLRTFKVTQEKGFFCYEYINCAEKLKETQLPPIHAFWSNVKNRNILDDEKYEDYQRQRQLFPEKSEDTILIEMKLKQQPKSKEYNYNYLKLIWEKENMRTLKDLLVWYNNLDVGPGVEGIKKLKKFYWEEMSVDIFKEVISVSGIARKLLFRMSKEEGFVFASIDNANRDLHECIKANIVGGPSVIFTRYHKALKTHLRRNPDKICQSCVGYDANALYLNCLSQDLPISYFVRWRPININSHLFRKDKSERYTIAFDWLDWISYRNSISISHKLNSGEEKCIGPYFVDGFHAETQTCYEFYGCYFHECPKDDCPIYKVKKGSDKYERTVQREAFIRKMGYNVESIWECTFKEQCKTNCELKDFVKQKDLQFSRNREQNVKKDEIIQGILDESLFGMIEVDIHVPQGLYDHFSEMSPLFVTSKIPFKDIGEHMQRCARDQCLDEGDKTLLVGGMRARRLLLATPLLKWYLEHGLIVTHVHQVVEFGKGKCFASFAERITTARRLGDDDADLEITADTMKLIGNSAYGSLLLQKEKHTSCKYVHGVHKARIHVNKPEFISLTELPSENYEILSSKRRTTLDLPIQIGFFVLQYAKLRMLQFYYDFLDVFTDRSNFECLQMDTDSLYLAITGNSISDIVRPERKEEFDRMLNGHCDQIDITSSDHFFPRTCCQKHSKRDKRTPGLFKLESKGMEMACLNSKTYVLQIDEKDPEKIKLSSKGLNKTSVTEAMKNYKQVLQDTKSRCVVNKGFRSRNNTVYTYNQTRWGMSYFYCKRIVQSDGISTLPLDIELVPAKLNE